MTNEKYLKTLSKEQLFDLMSKTLDEILLLSEDPKNEEKTDEKRDEIQLLRKALYKIKQITLRRGLPL